MNSAVTSSPRRKAEMADDAKPAPSCTFVIFGASGDLTKRLLVPAIYNLKRAGLLPENFAIVGVARRDDTDESFRKDIESGLREFGTGDFVEADWRWLAARMHYIQGEFDDAATYKSLAKALSDVADKHKTGGNCLFYLATPAQVFATIVQKLGEANLAREADGQWRRVIIEKPFGHDLPSAQELNRQILAVLAEDQVYRIDHYLGKETVRNIMVLRFANGLFEPLWNRDHIDHIQITVAETVGVETRGKFYDATGALRDMVPNHLFQLLTLAAMEAPTCFSANALRSEKAKVLEAVHHFGPEDARSNVVRAQYGAGTVDGKPVVAYRRAPDVAANSTTETYVAMKLMVDNWRWVGVPFYLRTGKALAERRSEIVIHFKRAPLALFRNTPVEHLASNDLVLHIQPGQSIGLRFGAKIPGPNIQIAPVEMKFNYEDYFKTTLNTGYETLLYDCMIGDPMLFQRADNIEGGWSVVQPVLDAWAQDRVEGLPTYAAGSAGPAEADALLGRDGRRWRTLRGKGDEKPA
jgi:glucose-6-phosphate 1-dehydrogenase